MHNINLIWTIAGIGIIVGVLNTVLRHSGKDEQGQLLTLAAVVIVLTMVVMQIQNLFSAAQAVFRF